MRQPAPWLAIGSTVCALAGLAACSAERGTATGRTDTYVPVAVIDTDATLTNVEPGGGVGLFVEYASGGLWRIYLTCDTLESERPCQWDVLVFSGQPLRVVAPAASETTEPLAASSSAVRFAREVTTEVEELQLESTPGSAIRLDVLFDGEADGRYTYWVGGGAVHRGAPSPVMDLLPTAP